MLEPPFFDTSFLLYQIIYIETEMYFIILHWSQLEASVYYFESY